MKPNLIVTYFCALASAAALIGVAAMTGHAAETETKSKSKSSSAETKKSDAKKSETKKSDAKKSDASKGKTESDTKKAKATPAEVKRAAEVLDQLSTSQKSALTKLINGGTKKELMSLPGIGDTIADAIIKARPLESAAYLVTVDGIGEKTFAEIVKSRK